MLGRKTVTTQVTYPGAPTIAGANQLTGGQLELSFHVEEDEMLVDLELRAVLTLNAAVAVVTFFVDDVNLGGGTGAGLMKFLGNATAEGNYVHLVKTERFAKGQHFLRVEMTHAAAPVIEGAVIPAELVARRHSHPATLGHGVDSKAQLIQ